MDQFWKKLKERYLLEFPTATEHEITAFYMKVTTLLPSFSGNTEKCFKKIITEEKELKENGCHTKGIK